MVAGAATVSVYDPRPRGRGSVEARCRRARQAPASAIPDREVGAPLKPLLLLHEPTPECDDPRPRGRGSVEATSPGAPSSPGRSIPDREVGAPLKRLELPERPAEPVSIPDREVSSEEHTSELQSRRDLVCRLLLE